MPHTSADEQVMLAAIGVKSFDELVADIPASVRYPKVANFLKLSEPALLQQAESLASQNIPATGLKCFLGAGAYNHYIPAVVNSLAARGEFMTAYTPYQPEVSQGTLRIIYEFQSLISELTGMPVTNASLYDGATAAAEAAMLALAHTKKNTVAIHKQVHPEYQKVIQTYVHSRGLHTQVFSKLEDLSEANMAGVIFQSPSFEGEIFNLKAVAEKVHAWGALLIQIYNPISLGMLATPGEVGVDIAVAEGQSLGVPLQFGGPYVGLFSCRQELIRLVPGRLIGKTKDVDGKSAYVLTLQTREQHIRREKATSNICTNQGLMALRTVLYMSAVGRQGLVDVARLCFSKAQYLKTALSKISGVKINAAGTSFHEFVVELPVPAKLVLEKLLEQKILGGLDLGRIEKSRANQMLVCCTEVLSKQDLDLYVSVLQKVLQSNKVPAHA